MFHKAFEHVEHESGGSTEKVPLKAILGKLLVFLCLLLYEYIVYFELELTDYTNF